MNANYLKSKRIKNQNEATKLDQNPETSSVKKNLNSNEKVSKEWLKNASIHDHYLACSELTKEEWAEIY